MEEDDDDFFGQYEDSYVRVSPVEYKVWISVLNLSSLPGKRIILFIQFVKTLQEQMAKYE